MTRPLPAAVAVFERPADAFAKPAVTASWFEECAVEAEEWLVERLLPRNAYTGLFGARGSAKSFLALDLACCGATGRPFLGEQVVQPFGSIYCVGEKKARFQKRVVANRMARGSSTPPAVLFRWDVPNLLDHGEVEAFAAWVHEVKPHFASRGTPLGAIFFDTLARCLRHANVSDADAAGTAIEAIQYLVTECGVTIIPLAHVAKAAGSSSQKGAGEWEDAADALIRIDRKDADTLRTVTLTKQSDEADGLAYAFDLQTVKVGETPSGRPVTSCVIRQLEMPEGGTNAKPAKLNAPAEMVLRALGRMEDAGQVWTGAPVPFGKVGVDLDALREATYALGLHMEVHPGPGASATHLTTWTGTRRKAFQRALQKLVEVRRAHHEGQWVWRL